MKKIKKYDFTKPPRKGNMLLYPIAWTLSLPSMKYHNLHVERVGMDGLKPPYLLLSNHQSFYDLKLVQRLIFPHRANFVTSLHAFAIYTAPIMRGLGCIAKRRFVPMDMALIRNMKYSVEKNKSICVLYPEARFTLDGKRSYIPNSVGKLVKLLGVPVVTLNMHGCFLANPQYNGKKYKHVPLKAELKQIVTASEIGSIAPEEINARVLKNLTYDEFSYQLENNIKITDPDRARGLEGLLYQCPHCYSEHTMVSSGTTLRCEHCGKAYEYTELGELRALDGETEFSHIPDWFDWQRANVAREVAEDKFFFEDVVEVYTLPNAKKFLPQGGGRVEYSPRGFKLVCKSYGEDREVFWRPEETYGVHIEYNFKGKGDALEVSKIDESYWLYPTKKNVVTKLSLAFEEIFRFKSKQELLV